MKNYILYLLIIVIGLFNQYMIGQEIELTSKDSIIQSSWIVGLGINIVDDSGDAFGDLFAVNEQWNMVSHPSRISIGKYFKSGLGIEAVGTYNKYKVGKIVDNTINANEKDYFGFDTRVTYDLNKILGETGFFDPYVGIGAGFTKANDVDRGTYNAVVGFRTWISDKWGLDINSTGKWSMGNDATNHIQHAVGVVYQFGIEKVLSNKGLEKLAMLQELEKENQRVQDSITAVKEAEELTKASTNKLQKEKEAAVLAQREISNQEELIKKKKLENTLASIGEIYFSLNSSFISTKDKEVLNKLVLFIQDNPDLIISVTSHTDSRGSKEYNQWLSDKRLKRALDYIISKGVNSGRVSSKALGEQQLTNECIDEVYCSEEKHRVNRRLEFLIQDF